MNIFILNFINVVSMWSMITNENLFYMLYTNLVDKFLKVLNAKKKKEIIVSWIHFMNDVRDD